MAVLAMDQNGLMLADLMPRGIPVRSGEGAAAAWEKGCLPIFLPGKKMREDDPLPRNWDVTSDSITVGKPPASGQKRSCF
jgi:aspartokinase-like uncharacterized kinase